MWALCCQNVAELGQNVNIKEWRLCCTFGDSAWVFQLTHTNRVCLGRAPLGVKPCRVMCQLYHSGKIEHN